MSNILAFVRLIAYQGMTSPLPPPPPTKTNKRKQRQLVKRALFHLFLVILGSRRLNCVKANPCLHCFASLAQVYHYLINLIKWNFWILKKHNSFGYLWKFEPNIPNSFGEIRFEKPQNLQRMYELIDVLPPRNFAVFVKLLLFSLLLMSKSWNLHKLHNLTSSFNFCT